MKKKMNRIFVIALSVVGLTTVVSAQNQVQNQDQFQTQRRQQRGGGGGGGFGRQTQYGGQRQMTGDAFTDQYGAIVEHNIFMRDRRRAPERPQNVARVLTAEESFVLTAIVREDNEYRAYAENVSQPGSPVVKLKVNDPIARGKVAEMTIDQLAYEHDGEKVWVSAGANLTGNQVLDISSLRIGSRPTGDFTGNNGGGLNSGLNAGGGFNGGFNNNNNFNGGGRGGGGRRGGGAFTTVTVPAPPLPAGDAANLSIEERMKLRRQAESLPGAAVPRAAIESLAPAPVEEAPAVVQPEGPIVPGAEGLTVEEQLRLRRTQQLGN